MSAPRDPLLTGGSGVPCPECGGDHYAIARLPLPLPVRDLQPLTDGIDRALRSHGRVGTFLTDGAHTANVVYAVTKDPAT